MPTKNKEMLPLISYFNFFPEIRIQANIEWVQKSILLSFEIYDPSNIILNPLSEELKPSRRNELWKHTCFEAFLKLPQTTHYFEINQNQSKDWNVYEFSEYRTGMQESKHLMLMQLSTQKSEPQHKTKIISEYQWSQNFLSQNNFETLQVGLCAVIESVHQTIDYYGITHSNKDQPDFHHFNSYKYTLSKSEN